MRRRDFIAFVGGAAAVWPLAARTQQSAKPVIGFLTSGSFDALEEYVAAVRKGLSEAGSSEQRNVRINHQSGPFGKADAAGPAIADVVSLLGRGLG